MGRKKTTPEFCQLKWCNRVHYSRGYCKIHYRRLTRNDKPTTGDEDLILVHYESYLSSLAETIHGYSHKGNFKDCKFCKEIINDPKT